MSERNGRFARTIFGIARKRWNGKVRYGILKDSRQRNKVGKEVMMFLTLSSKRISGFYIQHGTYAQKNEAFSAKH